MGISYVVNFVASENIGAIADSIAEKFEFPIDPSHCGRSPLMPLITLVANQFEIDVVKACKLTQQMFLDDFNLVINTHVRFYTWDNFARSEGGWKIAEVTNYLLEKYPGDLALLFNEEIPLLLRSQSRIIINSKMGFWTSLAKSAIAQPFEEKPLCDI